MYDTYLLYLLTFGYCWNGSFAIPMFFLLFVTQPHGVGNYHNIMAIIYFKRLCIFGPKGAIQIRYYYLLLLSRGDYLSFFLVLSRMRLAVWLSGNALVSDQRSYSTPGPVSAWMGDCLQAGKLSPYVTSHPGQLSLAIRTWVGAMSTVLG